jgi:beta-galactosidase
MQQDKAHPLMRKKPTLQFQLFLLVFLGLLAPLLAIPQSSQNARNSFAIDASAPVPEPESSYFQMGSSEAGRSPSGRSLSVNSQYLVLDGKPWLPVMGEMHFTRYPEKFWEEEILKMKAGGIQVISTYVFWIHHEEVEGQFDWSGDRNLRHFVELCAKHGLYVYPRIGPWAHGEVRNGGFPDWLLTKGPTRVNNPAYLQYVQRYYGEIAKQLSGLLWKQGGPVIGLQLENEYADRSPEGGAPYIAKLKQMALGVGLDLPLYTVTGWDNAVIPPHIAIPVFGGYPDEPWAGTREEMPPDTQGIYQFHYSASNAPTGILQAAQVTRLDAELWRYPRFTAELGGGMQITYHRRVAIGPGDIPPIALTALGSGVNLIGYYMYQGGANPQGKLTTLQESQDTNYPNDVPVKSYDFQSPLGEYGQVNESFRALAVVHQFIRDFGGELATMRANAPDRLPFGSADTSTLRISARIRDDSGFLFFNNYIRHYPMPEQKSVQVRLKLKSATLSVPEAPFNVPLQSAFILPVNLNMSGAILHYATVQPLAKFDDGAVHYYFFTEIPGISSELVFETDTTRSLKISTGVASRDAQRTFVRQIPPSTNVVVEFQTNTGATIRIVVLSRAQAENSYRFSYQDREYFLITQADFFTDGKTIHLRSQHPDAFAFSVLPDFAQLPATRAPLQRTRQDGVFARYTATVNPKQILVSLDKTQDPGPSTPVPMGKPVEWRHGPVAQAPDESAFANAGIWRIILPAGSMTGVNDIFLRIQYTGDVARVYDRSLLVDDNFYNGTPWEIGLKRYPPLSWSQGWDLKVLPLRSDAPIYLPKDAWPIFNGKIAIASVKAVTASPEYEVTMTPPSTEPQR